MIPASTYNAKSVAAFPDVCTTPSPGGPIPIPYPSAGPGSTTAPVAKTTVKTAGAGSVFKSVPRSMGNEAGMVKGIVSNTPMAPAQLGGKLQALHAQILALPAGNPNRWHQLLDEYVIMTAELYKVRVGG